LLLSVRADQTLFVDMAVVPIMQGGAMTNQTRATSSDSSPVLREWDMSKEREFIDQLLGERFNFFILFFSLTLNEALDNPGQEPTFFLPSILLVGAVVSWLLSMSIFRLQQKLDVILREVHNKNGDHPAMEFPGFSGDRV